MNYLQCMYLAVLNSDVDLRLFDVNDAHHYKPEGRVHVPYVAKFATNNFREWTKFGKIYIQIQCRV